MLDPISASLRATVCILGALLFLALLADLERHHRAFCAMHPDEKSCTGTATDASNVVNAYD